MAIIKEYITPAGTTIKFNNAAYIDKTDAQKEQIKENINKTISIIYANRKSKKEEVNV